MSSLKENNTPTFDIYTRIEELLGIDLRSLGLFRIALGSILLIDLVVRATSLSAHYTDAGVVPRSLIFEYGEQPWFLSFHMLSGGLTLQVTLFVFTGICALALMTGYRSRFACFLCWALMLSLHVRNPFVNNLGDWLLVDLLFWSIFLPIGARFSIDTKLKPASQILPVRVLSIATLAILLQICFVYFFSVMHKISPVWHSDGTAIQFALNLDRIVSRWGQALLNLPEEWLKFMTFATLYLEKWGPVLLFFPLLLGPGRTIIAFAFIGFHLGLAIFFELGLFPFICISAWVLFFPSWLWDHIGIRARHFYSIPGWCKSEFERLYQWFFRERAGKIAVVPGGLESVVATFSLFCMLSSGLMYGGLMDEVYYERIYKFVEPVVNTVNMRQRWDMFSPQPPRNDGWFVVAAYTQQQEVLNLLQPEKEFTWSRPDNIAQTYKNQRWRKYLEWVMNKQEAHARHFEAYSEILYHTKYSASGDLLRINVYFMQETTLLDLNTSSVVRRKLN